MRTRDTIRDDEIVSRRANGQSFSAIAKEMGLASRSVVAGVTYRMAHRDELSAPSAYARGERTSKAAKLDVEQVRAIRKARAAGEKLESLASLYGLDQSSISLIARGKRHGRIAP